MVFIGVDLEQIDKMAPRRVKSAPGPIELNQHFGAKTDLLDLECGYLFATVLNTKYYRNRQNSCMAKAWLHGCVVTQLEKERK